MICEHPAASSALTMIHVHLMANTSTSLDGIEHLVSFLAVTRARLVAAPMNPAYKTEEFQFVLEDSEARIVLTTSGSGSGPRSRSRLEPAGLDRKPDCDRRCATLWPRAQLVYEGRRGYAVASGRCPLDAHHTLCTSRRRPDRPSRSIQRPCLLVSGQGARCHLVFSRADHPSDPSGARGLRQCAVTQRISVRPIVLPKPTGRLQGPQGHLPRHGAAKGLDRQSAALPSEAVAFKVVTPRR